MEIIVAAIGAIAAIAVAWIGRPPPNTGGGDGKSSS